MERVILLIAGMLLGTFGSLTIAASAAAPVTALTQDPVTLRPERFKVLLENDRVRVVEYRNSPGGRQTMHSHPDGVVYYLNDSKSKQIYPDGTTKETKHKAGDVASRAAVTHATENIGTTETHYIAIDLKDKVHK